MTDKEGIVEACFCILALLAVAGVLIAAFAFVDNVQVTIDEAILGRLALAASVAGDGTAAASRLSYDLSVVVAVYNPNWAMSVWRTAPPDAELRLRISGAVLDRVQMMAGWRLLSPLGRKRASHHFTAADKRAPVAAAELAHRESAAAWVFELELVVTGQFKYEAHSHKRSLRVICPLDLALSTAMSPAAFQEVACT